MRRIHTALLAGAATFLVAGTAVAAADKMHATEVAVPSGSVVHIEYTGDVAPTISVEPIDAADTVFIEPIDATMPAAFADLERISAMMEQRARAMMQLVAQMQREALSGNAPVHLVADGNLPAGSHHYSFLSSSSGNGACTQTVEWSSDGSGQEPRVTRTSSGDCGTAKSDSPVTSVSAPAEQHAAPGRVI